MNPLTALTAKLRKEAELMRQRGLEREARLEESIAEDIETALRAWEHEELTIQEAAQESGYTPKTLRRMVRQGRIPDSRPDGSRAEIRIRRCDLPRKPGGERDPVSEAVERHVQRATGSGA